MKRKTHIYGDKIPISPYHLEDPDAKVLLGRIDLSWLQKRMLRIENMCYLTDEQQLIMDKFVDKKISIFPAGYDAFIRPDLVYEYVWGEPCLLGMHPFDNEEDNERERENERLKGTIEPRVIDWKSSID